LVVYRKFISKPKSVAELKQALQFGMGLNWHQQGC